MVSYGLRIYLILRTISEASPKDVTKRRVCPLLQKAAQAVTWTTTHVSTTIWRLRNAKYGSALEASFVAIPCDQNRSSSGFMKKKRVYNTPEQYYTW